MNFYEVLVDGYHSPLTKTQIAELFHVGRLRREHRCKPVSQDKWQTIDELFPLLKYQSAGPALYDAQEANAPSAKTWILMVAFLAAAIAAAVVWYYFASDAAGPASSTHVTTQNWPRTIQSSTATVPTVVVPKTTDFDVTIAPPVAVEAPRQSVATQPTQLARERMAAEQREREQMQAERDRMTAERARKDVGQNIIFPLDVDAEIQNVGGSSVALRIHDIDVTSFDVRANGVWRRSVLKQKGITGSQADETFIYGNGRANLYYVWEISGRLNHCLLRVREE